LKRPFPRLLNKELDTAFRKAAAGSGRGAASGSPCPEVWSIPHRHSARCSLRRKASFRRRTQTER